jgi:hypothetical protein
VRARGARKELRGVWVGRQRHLTTRRGRWDVSHEGSEDGHGVDTIPFGVATRRNGEEVGRAWGLDALVGLSVGLGSSRSPSTTAGRRRRVVARWKQTWVADPMAGVPWWHSRRPGLTQGEEDWRENAASWWWWWWWWWFRSCERWLCFEGEEVSQEPANQVAEFTPGRCEFLRGSTGHGMPLKRRTPTTPRHVLLAQAVQLSKCSFVSRMEGCAVGG